MGDHLGVEQEDGEHWLGHHGEQLVVKAVHVAETHVLGDSQPPHELQRSCSEGQRERRRAERPERKDFQVGGGEGLEEVGPEAYLVHDVGVSLEGEPPLPHGDWRAGENGWRRYRRRRFGEVAFCASAVRGIGGAQLAAAFSVSALAGEMAN